MSAQIKYAYLKDHTWIFRRNYPEAVALLLGSRALKRSLKTSDLRTAQARAVEVNAVFERQVQGALEGATQPTPDGSAWANPSRELLAHLRGTLAASDVDFSVVEPEVVELGSLCRSYLMKRKKELRPSGFKSVRYSVELFWSRYGALDVRSLGREEGKAFLAALAQLSPLLGKAKTTQGLSLDGSIRWSATSTARITPKTQRRIWSQVNTFLDWVVYEGQLDQNPFRTVRFDQKVRQVHYAVPTDDEVVALLSVDSPIRPLLTVCLLSGMRSGEAVGMNRDDIVDKGNLGCFFLVRPNDQRELKTDAAQRLVPVHSSLLPLLERLPGHGPLFPQLDVNTVTKRFAELRERLNLDRPGLVFHSTRKWFITQCERTGVPEHWTASLVGHASARSENGLTYSIYSSGISDEQRRAIVDQLKLP